jgi:hypothetical protein
MNRGDDGGDDDHYLHDNHHSCRHHGHQRNFERYCLEHVDSLHYGETVTVHEKVVTVTKTAHGRENTATVTDFDTFTKFVATEKRT